MHSESGHCSRTFNLKGAWYHCAEAIVNNVITIQCHEETVDNVRTKIVKQKIKREAAIIHQRNMQIIKRLQFKVKRNKYQKTQGPTDYGDPMPNCGESLRISRRRQTPEAETESISRFVFAERQGLISRKRKCYSVRIHRTVEQ